MRGQEGSNLRCRRHRLLHRLIHRRNGRVGERYASHSRHRVIDALKRRDSHIGHRGTRNRGGSRVRRLDERVREGAKLVERQEEHVVCRSLIDGDDRTDGRQHLSARSCVARRPDGRGQRRIRLSRGRDDPIDAKPHAGDDNVGRRRLRIEADERRIGEEIAVGIVLGALDLDVRLRDTRQRTHVEQQEVLLADAGIEVLQDLGGRESAAVDGSKLDRASPPLFARDFATHSQSKRAVPARQRATASGVLVGGQRAIDIQLLAIDRIVGQHDVLQRCLGHVLRCRIDERRRAIGVRRAAACTTFIRLGTLRQRGVPGLVTAGIRHDVGFFLGDVVRVHPRFEGELARALRQLRNLLAGGGRGLRLTTRREGQTPAAGPRDAAVQSQVRRGADTAGVVGDVARAGLEHVLRDDIRLVAGAAGSDRTFLERQCFRHHESRIDVGGRYAGRVGLQRTEHDRRTARAVGCATRRGSPAVMQVLR